MAVRHYKIMLTTVGPVHIGNGSSYNKKDYFKIDDKNVAVLDIPKFISGLSDDELEEYCDFLYTDSRSSLQDFIDRHRNLVPQARKCILYKVEVELAKARRGTDQFFDVAQFVKDAHGCPYVPGSSVKGMIRTALLNYLILKNRPSYAALYDSSAAQNRDRRISSNACRRIERKAFWQEHPGGGTEANDIMRYVSVSDSYPLSTNDLVFVKKYDKFSRNDAGRHKLNMGNISSDSGYYDGNELNIYRECIRPGTRIELAFDIDERIDAYLAGLTLDGKGMSSLLESSYEVYRHCFLENYDSDEAADANGAGGANVDDGRCCYVYQSGPFAGMRCRNRAVGGTCYCNSHKDCAPPATSSTTCYLGGGVDFDSKTVINALFEDDSNRVTEIARILYAQFPTKLDRSKHRQLESEVRDAGFEPLPMRAQYKRGRLTRAKDDHRHWEDEEFGVSPHTMKLGIISGKRLPMGKCSFEVEEVR